MALETTAIITAATPLVKSLVEKLVSPKIDKFADWCTKKYKEVMIPTAEHFQEYLERSYEKNSIINTLVFHNSQRQLKDVYVAQTLVLENCIEGNKETIKIDKLPVKLIKKYKKILITDTAGMGKSTIMKRMFIDLIDNGMADIGIPIYIELNRLNKDHTIITEIQEELNSLSDEFDKDMLLKFIQTGGFIFFLDGFDEISIKDRSEVAINIHTFVSKAGNKNYYILTSRPESGLASFGDFQSFTIQPLTKKDAFKLLKKYDLSKKKELSKKLVELLNSGQYNTIDEYLVNPLLVSLLYTAYDYNQSIPFEKHRFYGVVFDAYFEKHDSSKPIKSRDKFSGLNHDGFDSILRYVGYRCLTSIGVKFDEDTILNTIREARTFCGNLSFSESDLLKDLVSSVPLFCKDGTDYKWVHKSLLEYFAARFVFCDAKRNQDAILSAIYKSEHIEKYINMLDIYYDIDYKGFSKNIILPICERYEQFYNDSVIVSSINKNLIEERIGHLFMQNYAFVRSSMKVEIKRKANIKLLRREFPHNMIIRFSSELERDDGVFFGNTKIEDIIKLLFIKRRSLFSVVELQSIVVEDELKMIIKSFEEDRVYHIEMKLGEEDELLYKAFNAILSVIKPWYLNYKACKEEIDRIRKEISQYNNPDDLLIGI